MRETMRLEICGYKRTAAVDEWAGSGEGLSEKFVGKEVLE